MTVIDLTQSVKEILSNNGDQDAISASYDKHHRPRKKRFGSYTKISMSKDKGTQGHVPEMTVGEKSVDAQHSATSAESEEEPPSLVEELLQHVAKSKAIFKSQQKDDPDLKFEEKLKIARCILEKSHCLFLSKFGHFLKTEHLKYFDKEDYEVSYHINRLQRYFNDSARQIDVKNRRYEALKELMEKGEYFSEKEMMKRNPLLYDHLVGQYMTEKQKKARDNIDTKNITFVNLLLERIERNGLEEKQKLQEEEERNVLEERDSDEDSDDTDAPKESNSPKSEQNDQTKMCAWGETDQPENSLPEKRAPKMITKTEQQILKQEFLTNMYQSFLDGKDQDFDYSTVDNNEAYDNVVLRTQDEEEKYFDSESPETVGPVENSNQSESEDELDAYMKSLKEGIATNTVSGDNQT